MDTPSKVAYDVSAIVNQENAEYHRFLRRGELRLQACGKCSYLRHPARFVCPECLSEELEWKLLSGSARVETFIWYFKNILDRRYTSAWAYQDAPYNVSVIKLAEGPRLVSNVDRTSFEQLRVGQAVKASFVPISDDYAILRFVPQ
jgi:uncharacterized OB-fold protein